MNVELLTAFLEHEGYGVATATDGNRALELGVTGEFQAAILDVHMPMYDGIEVLKMLRRRHILHPMKVIALTGDPTEGIREDLAQGGIDAYMVKPVDLDVLRQKLVELVGAPR